MPGNLAELSLMGGTFELAVRPEPSGASWKEVIARARAGDAAAFDQLVAGHERRVLSIAWHLLGNREEALDAAQETFLRVYRHFKGFDESQDFDGWLYRITINVSRDLARKRNRVAAFELSCDPIDLPEPAGRLDDPEANLRRSEEQAQSRKMIAEALDTLSERERATIIMRDIEGRSTEDVARILGSRPATVRSQIWSARMKIKLFREKALNRPRQGRK
jgi:RNA polymerase sigma-70 factor, ECF subfamily